MDTHKKHLDELFKKLHCFTKCFSGTTVSQTANTSE